MLFTNPKLDSIAGLHLKDLKIGDVILSRGICPGKGICLSDIIVKLDGGDYSHAAFFDGENFVQATTKGVKASQPVRIKAHQSYLHVYRFHDAQDNPLDSPNLPSAPLVSQAHGLLNLPYAYDELALVAILVCLRKTTSIPLLKDLLELFGGYALTHLRDWIKKYILQDDKQSIICSELVAETFWKASDKGLPYGIPIQITDRHKLKINNFSAEQIDSYDKLVEELEGALSEIQPSLVAQIHLHRDQQEQVLLGSANSTTLIAGSTFLPANCVSPCDLQRSTGLTCVGNYLD